MKAIDVFPHTQIDVCGKMCEHGMKVDTASFRLDVWGMLLAVALIHEWATKTNRMELWMVHGRIWT